MFKKGEYVVYGSVGLCHIEDITHMSMTGTDKNKLYYVLKPFRVKDRKIYTPIDNEKVRIRKVISSEEAIEMIDEALDINVVSIKDEKRIEEKFKELARQGKPKDWIRLIKTLYVRKQERNSQGKKITATDEKYMKMAENHLYSELGFALGIKEDEMEEYITQKVNKAKSLYSDQ